MRPGSMEEEAVLVDRAKTGDREAFEELVRRHAEHLNAVVMRFLEDTVEAQDVTQEAFLRAWRGIGSFKGESAFFTWLYRIGLNEAKRRIDQRPRHGQSLDDQPVPVAADRRQAPEARSEQRDLRRELERAIRGLSLEYRTALVLRDIEGLSTREAAEVMDLGEAAFKSRLHRARLEVRRRMEHYYVECER